VILHQNSWFIPLRVHLPKMEVFLIETGSARTIYLLLLSILRLKRQRKTLLQKTTKKFFKHKEITTSIALQVNQKEQIIKFLQQ